jgi:hypothetical protein
VELNDRGGQTFGESGDVGLVIAAHGENDGVRGCGTGRGVYHKATVGPGDQRDAYTFLQRCFDSAGVVLHIGDDIVADHEAVWLVAGIIEAGQFALPVRRHQAEAVPALRAPGMADAIFLEYDVIDGIGGQVVAHGQAGLAAADHGDTEMRDFAHGIIP